MYKSGGLSTHLSQKHECRGFSQLEWPNRNQLLQRQTQKSTPFVILHHLFIRILSYRSRQKMYCKWTRPCEMAVLGQVWGKLFFLLQNIFLHFNKWINTKIVFQESNIGVDIIFGDHFLQVYFSESTFFFQHSFRAGT